MRGFAAGMIGGSVWDGSGHWQLGLAAAIFCMVVFLSLRDIEETIKRLSK